MSTIVVSGSTPAEVSVTIPQVNSISVTPPEVRSISVSANVPSNARLIPAGGAEGVILRKDSVADYDVEWTTYSFPLADGDDGQVLTTDGAGTISFSYPKTIAEDVKNVSGGTLLKGTPVHVTGSVGNLAEVIAADAATNYPAHFVLNEDLDHEGEGLGIAIGFINNVDVPDASIYTEGQTVYLGAAGGWTTTKPTGANAIQNLGIIIKVNVTGGGPAGKISGIIMGAGRANDVPNIATGNIWAGNVDGVATATDTAYIDIANGRVGIGTTTPSDKLHVSDYQPSSIVWAKIENTSLVGAAGAGVSYKTPNRTWQTVGRETGYSIENTTAGSTPFNISSSGKVGIGTTSPNYLLDVEGSGAGARVYNTVGSTSVYLTTPAAQNASLYFGPSTDINEGGITYRTSSSSMAFTTNTSEAMRIDSSGNVGIGTANPNSKLEVAGNIAFTNKADSLTFGSAGADGTWGAPKITRIGTKIIVSDYSGVEFGGYDGSAYGARMTVLGTGNVGIGTTSPASKLDVRGTARITSPQANDWIVLAQNSAAGAPSGFWDSNGNVHLYLRDSSSNNNVLIRPNSTSWFNGGNVGIGTTSPVYALHVVGNTFSSGAIGNKGVNIGQQLELGTSAVATLRFDADAWRLYSGGAGSSGEVFRVTETGNVGIGTTSPDARLEVNTASTSDVAINANDRLKIFGNGTMSWGASSDYGKLSWDTGYALYQAQSGKGVKLQVDGSSTAMTLTTGGNVGIGTTSPLSWAKLHVAGDSYTTGTVTADTNLRVRAGGSDKVIIHGNGDSYFNGGNVGIGTTSPNNFGFLEKVLNVSAGSSSSTTLQQAGLVISGSSDADDADDFGYLSFTNHQATVSNGRVAEVRVVKNGTDVNTGEFAFYTSSGSGAAERMRIAYNGNVGIGTGSPLRKLHVVGDIELSGGIYGSTTDHTYLEVGNSGYDHRFFTRTNVGASLERFRIEGGALEGKAYFQNTNVGIGTASPSAKLDVVGLANIKDGSNNVMISSANTALTAGFNNTAVGYQAARAVSTANNNTAIGYIALNNTNTSYNTAVGAYCLKDNTLGERNTAVGWYAAQDSTGSYNSFLGMRAGRYAGGGNTAIGYDAATNTTGNNNVIIGREAGYGSATSAYSNTVAVGYQALYDLTTGANNTAVGYNAGANITNGDSNTSVGFEALTTTTTADNNSAFGKHALRYNTTGYNNTGVGTAALYNTAGGANNVAVGLQALLSNTSGSENTAVGVNAGYTNSTGSRNIFIGYQAGYNETGSDKLYINNSSGSNPLIYGDFNLRTATINGDLNVSSGNLRADAVEINGRALAATPAAGEYGAGSKIVTQFASGTVTAGKVYVANAGSWAEGDANVGSTSIGMIAVATDSASAAEMLIEGVVKLSSNTGFSGAAAGTVLYLSTTAGELTTTAPSTAGEYVRVCGYVVNQLTNEVFFSPSKEWRVV